MVGCPVTPEGSNKSKNRYKNYLPCLLIALIRVGKRRSDICVELLFLYRQGCLVACQSYRIKFFSAPIMIQFRGCALPSQHTHRLKKVLIYVIIEKSSLLKIVQNWHSWYWRQIIENPWMRKLKCTIRWSLSMETHSCLQVTNFLVGDLKLELKS